MRYSIPRYLDRVARCYPYGIEEDLLRRARAALKTKIPENEISRESTAADKKNIVVRDDGQRKCVIFLIAAKEGTLTPLESELLTSIIEKGLGIQVEDTITAVGDAGLSVDAQQQWLEENLRGNPARVAVVMGCNQLPLGVHQRAGALQLHTTSLFEIATQPASKRAFWNVLKSVIPYVR